MSAIRKEKRKVIESIATGDLDARSIEDVVTEFLAIKFKVAREGYKNTIIDVDRGYDGESDTINFMGTILETQEEADAREQYANDRAAQARDREIRQLRELIAKYGVPNG